LTPRHRESDTVVHRGHITKQGSKLVRWAAIEAVQRHQTTAKIAADKDRIAAATTGTRHWIPPRGRFDYSAAIFWAALTPATTADSCAGNAM
jgi:hypothetical protein